MISGYVLENSTYLVDENSRLLPELIGHLSAMLGFFVRFVPGIAAGTFTLQIVLQRPNSRSCFVQVLFEGAHLRWGRESA